MLSVPFSCGSPPSSVSDVVVLEPEVWKDNPGYYTLNGIPQLLLGFDLRNQPIDSSSLESLVKTIKANGGNYLAINLSGISDQKVKQVLQLGNELTVVIDTVGDENYGRSSGSVTAFNAALLSGSPAQTYRQAVQPALNSFRAVRTVERHVNLWEMKIAEDLLGKERPEGTVAAADSSGNYLIYMAGSGAVTIRFRDSSQVARRVTVVGHLGTQRSEVLYPPYDDSFTLRSTEERGGWMIIEPLAED